MFNNVILDVAIGLVFIFLLYSLLATIVQELISTKLAFRSKVLEKAIIRMLEDGKSTNREGLKGRLRNLLHLFTRKNKLLDKEFVAWFYAHPLIKYLGEDNVYNKPAYLSARNFSKVITDLLKGFGETAKSDAQQISDSISAGKFFHLPIDLSEEASPAIKAIRTQLKIAGEHVVNPLDTSKINKDTTLFLKSVWSEANGDINVFRAKLEQWYDDTMERATGWYKRYIKQILFAIGMLMAVGFNVDSVSITRKLMHDPKLREQVVENANNYLKNNQQLGVQLADLKAKHSDESTFYKSMADDYERQRKESDKLLSQATDLVNSDVKNVNSMVALGWTSGFLNLQTDQKWWTAIIGWIITALAVSLGAPFWFDLLNKMTKLRGSVAKTGSAPDDGSQATGAA